MSDLVGFLEVFCGLIPVVAVAAPLIAIVVDALKKFGLIKEGAAGLVSGLLNLVAWAGLWFAARYGSEVQVSGIIENLTVIAPSVIALLVSLVGSKFTHWLLGELGIGYSFPEP